MVASFLRKFRVTKEELFLRCVKKEIVNLVADRMQLEYSKAKIEAQILANEATRIKLEESVPALTRLLEEKVALENAAIAVPGDVKTSEESFVK